MSAGLVLTAGVATVRRTSSSRTIHDVEEGSASGVFWRLRDRPSEETLWGESGGLNHRMLVLLPSHKGGLDHGRFIGKGLACHRVGLEHGANG